MKLPWTIGNKPIQGNFDAIVTKLQWGNGTPENVVRAKVGTLYLRQDGGASTTLYVKETGTGKTGWVAK
jgi:hypothetical protein